MTGGLVLDTCAISEPLKPVVDAGFGIWFQQQEPATIFLTSTVVSELAAGIARMPEGRRRGESERWLRDLIDDRFAGRILPFDVDAALLYGRFYARALAQGRPPSIADAQIAATAAAAGMSVVTRDVGDFTAFGVTLINPWTD